MAVIEEIRKRGELKVGTTLDYKPMFYIDSETDSYAGYDVDLVKELADTLNINIEYVKTSWPTLMEDTLAGKFDLAICGII